MLRKDWNLSRNPKNKEKEEKKERVKGKEEHGSTAKVRVNKN